MLKKSGVISGIPCDMIWGPSGLSQEHAEMAKAEDKEGNSFVVIDKLADENGADNREAHGALSSDDGTTDTTTLSATTRTVSKATTTLILKPPEGVVSRVQSQRTW